MTDNLSQVVERLRMRAKSEAELREMMAKAKSLLNSDGEVRPDRTGEARKLLAREYKREGLSLAADDVRRNKTAHISAADRAAIRAIEAALQARHLNVGAKPIDLANGLFRDIPDEVWRHIADSKDVAACRWRVAMMLSDEGFSLSSSIDTGKR